MAGLGFGELSSQLCQGESKRQGAVCVSQWQTDAAHCILDSVGNAPEKASLAPQRVALRADASAARTC